MYIHYNELELKQMTNKSLRTKHKCPFMECTETYRTKEGLNYHIEKRHRTWITPTTKTEKQMYDVSHVCCWNRSTANQINITQDKLQVEAC